MKRLLALMLCAVSLGVGAQTIADIVTAGPPLTILGTAIVEAGLETDLTVDGPFTLYAPTDSAFADLFVALDLSEEEFLSAPYLRNFLEYHMVQGQVLYSEMTDGAVVTNELGYELTFEISDGSVVINGAGEVIVSELNYDNGIVHIIDACLIPEWLLGCTDPTACNYDPIVLQPNITSCVYPDDCGECYVNGYGACTDPTACNYDPGATCDDGACVYLFGCTDEAACNYDPEAGCNNNSCEYESCAGCVDPSACNYDPQASLDDFSCDYTCIGCFDSVACNYDPGATINAFCEYIPEGVCDCDGNQEDALGVCGGDCTADEDADGICDDVDPCVGILDVLGECNGPCGQDFDMDGICDDIDECVGEYDECGVCNGPGAIYECGCVDIPQGFCDCDLNQLDALGVCGGDCAEDVNADGICDDLVDCTNIGAAFWQDLELGVYIPEPTPITPDSLPVDGIQFMVGDDLTEELVLNVPLVFVDEVTGGAFQVLSWSNLTAEGLPPGVELILPQDLIGGSQACVELTGDDYPTQEGFYEVVITGEVLLNIFGSPFSVGDVSTSFWIEVVSNPNGVPGCTYPTASNYMPWATYDSGVCEFTGCTDPSALNYSPSNSVDDGSCFYNDPNCVAESACPEDLNEDGAVGTPDLLLMLGEYGNFCD